MLFFCLLHSEGIALCREEMHPEVDVTSLVPGASKSMGHALLLGYRASPTEAHYANLSEY